MFRKNKVKIRKNRVKFLTKAICRLAYKKLWKILYEFEDEFAEFPENATFEKGYIFEALDYVLRKNGVKINNGKKE